MKIKVTCKVCGKEFKVSPSRITEGVKYCSRECMGESYCGESNPSWKGGSIKGICKYCGNVFYLSPGRAKKGEGSFCSQKCYALSRPQKVERKCEVCGNSFKVWQAYAAKGRGRFCSIECSRVYHKPKREKRKCEICGKVFFASLFEVKRGNAHFCSKCCAGKAQTFSKVRRERMRKARKHHVYPTHHTKPERVFKDICTKYNLPFRFTGNRSFWIGANPLINPDFIHTNEKRKICVEVLGAHWHNSMLNQKIVYDRTYNGRKALLKKNGWEMIGIWDHDLVRKDAEAFVLYTLEKHNIFPSPT